MCYNCGCGLPDDEMGNPDNITNNALIHLGEHWGKSFEETQKIVYSNLEKELAGESIEEDPHLTEMFEKAARAWGQTVKEAKKNTLSLLKIEIKY